MFIYVKRARNNRKRFTPPFASNKMLRPSTGEAFILSDFLLFMLVLIHILCLFLCCEANKLLENDEQANLRQETLHSDANNAKCFCLSVMQWHWKLFPFFYMTMLEEMLCNKNLTFLFSFLLRSCEKCASRIVERCDEWGLQCRFCNAVKLMKY